MREAVSSLASSRNAMPPLPDWLLTRITAS